MDSLLIHEDLCKRLDLVITKSIGSTEDTGSEGEEEIFVTDFDPELFFCKWQDRFEDVKNNLYLRFDCEQRNKFLRLRTNITEIKLEFASNCSLLLRVDFVPIKKRPTRSMLDGCNIRIYSKYGPKKLLEYKLSDDCQHEMVFYPDVVAENEKNTVFQMSGDLDVSETSFLFRIGYMEYDFCV